MNIDKNLFKNLDQPVNNFLRIEKVRSILLHGNSLIEDIPYISFVIPTFSRVKELQDSINSIVTQKEIYPYEIIVVDNSGILDETNETYQYIRRFDHPKILFYVNEQNIGMEGNWNRCIELARAAYISMLHDDDLLCNNYMEEIERCINTANSLKGNFGLIQSKYAIFSNIKELPKVNNKNRGGINKYHQINCLLDGKGPVSPPSCGILFSKQALTETGGFSEKYHPCADYILGYKVLRQKYNVFFSENYLGFYRLGVNESMKPQTIKNTIRFDYFFRDYLYTKSIFSKLFGLIFRNVQFANYVDGSAKHLKKYFNFELTNDYYSFAEGYRKYPLRTLLFKCFYKFVQIITNKIYSSKDI